MPQKADNKRIGRKRKHFIGINLYLLRISLYLVGGIHLLQCSAADIETNLADSVLSNRISNNNNKNNNRIENNYIAVSSEENSATEMQSDSPGQQSPSSSASSTSSLPVINQRRKFRRRFQPSSTTRNEPISPLNNPHYHQQQQQRFKGGKRRRIHPHAMNNNSTGTQRHYHHQLPSSFQPKQHQQTLIPKININNNYNYNNNKTNTNIYSSSTSSSTGSSNNNFNSNFHFNYKNENNFSTSALNEQTTTLRIMTSFSNSNGGGGATVGGGGSSSTDHYLNSSHTHTIHSNKDHLVLRENTDIVVYQKFHHGVGVNGGTASVIPCPPGARIVPQYIAARPRGRGEISPKVAPAPIISFLQYDETFHTNMRIYLTICQVFALMPISGISGLTAATLRYSFYNLRSIYSMLVIFLTLCNGGVILLFNYKTGFTFDKIFPLIWFTVNPFVMYQFIRIARKWPKLMCHWENFELTASYRDQKVHKKMRRILIVTSILIPSFAAIEHLFSLGNNINTARKCKKASNTFTAYFKGAFPAYFHFFEVNYLNGISLQILNLYSTFTWSMSDTFIVLVSLGLITQFQHFNEHFEKFRGMNLPPDFWGKQRYTFTKLTELLDHVNKVLAVLVLTSFSVNTFYICVQLYESVAPGESVIRRIYFWYSLIYLIGKTFMVSIVATFINDEAKKPIKVLESVPGSVYGSEASRFMTQLTSGTIALGGMDFFYLTRAFLISMAGTIVTYEIILIQLKSQPEGDVDPCEG